MHGFATIAPMFQLPPLTEPVAAALAYGVSSATRHETVLVFDLGGGTFDCSLLSTFAGIAEVLATDGDQWLGGDDWDTLLMQLLSSAAHPQAWPGGAKALRAVARDAKVTLSTTDQVVVEGPSDAVIIERLAWEAVAAPLLQRTLQPLRQLGEAGFVEWEHRCGGVRAYRLWGGSGQQIIVTVVPCQYILCVHAFVACFLMYACCTALPLCLERE